MFSLLTLAVANPYDCSNASRFDPRDQEIKVFKGPGPLSEFSRQAEVDNQ